MKKSAIYKDGKSVIESAQYVDQCSITLLNKMPQIVPI